MYPVKKLHSEEQTVQRNGNQQEQILYDEIRLFIIKVFTKSGGCADLTSPVGVFLKAQKACKLVSSYDRCQNKLRVRVQVSLQGDNNWCFDEFHS